MLGRDGGEVSDPGLEAGEEGGSHCLSNGRDGTPSLTDLEDYGHVLSSLEILRAGVDGGHVRMLEFLEGVMESIRNMFAMKQKIPNKQLVDGWGGG